MGKKDEFVPDQRVLEAIISEAIYPAVSMIEKDLGETLTAVVNIYSQDIGGPSIMLPTNDTGGFDSDNVRGEIRLRCRKTFQTDRVIFFCEAIFDGVAPQTGFSGFEIKGDAVISSEKIVVKRNSHIVRYNVWEWRNWI